MKKKIYFLVLLGVLVSGFFFGKEGAHRVILLTHANAKEENKNETNTLSGSGVSQTRYEQLELFQKVLNFVETNYVDQVKTEDLIQNAISGMLEKLDPHSNFLDQKIFKEMKIDTSGKFGGVGIEVGVKDDVLTVIAPIEGSPAWEKGILPGDRIIQIAGESTKGMTLSDAVVRMRGKKGSPVKITIFRQGFTSPQEIELSRKDIAVQSVRFEELEPHYGYVRLSTFNENATKDMQKAIESLEKKDKLKGLVFDLRNTPGGLLDQAIEVSSLFLDEGVIVSTVGRDSTKKEIKYAIKGKARKDMAVAVLVNSSTASAAEIVAGALQDHKRALILGEPTFGKGSVQTVVDLGKEMGLKLTIARYYTPSGRSIQEKGVIPDIDLDSYDTELLDKARLKTASYREKDLPKHLAGKEINKNEFSKDELSALVQSEANAPVSKKGSEVVKTASVEVKKDYQVIQAKNYLKSTAFLKK